MSGISYQYHPDHLEASEPTKYRPEMLTSGQTLINIGPQHPSTHGVLRLEVVLEGEHVVDVVPHIGYLHRCFEKHAEGLSYPLIIPFVDRLDYLAAINNEWSYCHTLEQMLGLAGQLGPRVEYIRMLLAELNRVASHFIAIGTYGLDIGAFSPFLWLLRDREHILRLLEWASGARMLYNYIWVGGLYYDLPLGFEEKCREFLAYLMPKLDEVERILVDNKIFRSRTEGVGVLPLSDAVAWGITGPMLRASGLAHDLRKAAPYSLYEEVDFAIPISQSGDCWARNWVRFQECKESVKIALQCVEQLERGKAVRTRDFNPQAMVPSKMRPGAKAHYGRMENPKGELGFYIESVDKSDIPARVKCRAPSFVNLAVLPTISRGLLLQDFIACIGSIDVVMGEVDR